MDVLNLWNEDPEELLLDLGFGCDEPDLSGRIPARFINYQSQARGINLQVFLEAQENRLDLENPDVSHRFRQLEVLQQVTTTLRSLVVSSSSTSVRARVGKTLPPEARERRRRIGILFRRALKKSHSQIHGHKTQDLTTSQCSAPESLQTQPSLGDHKLPLQRVKPELLECLSPLAEDRGAGPNPQLQPHSQERLLSPGPLRDGPSLTANTYLQREMSPGLASDSIGMEKALQELSNSYTGSQRSEMPGSPSSPPPHHSSSHLLAPSPISSDVDKSLLSSPRPLPESTKYDPSCSDMEKPPDQVQPPPASLSALVFPPCPFSPEIQNITHSQSPTLPSPAVFIPLSTTSSPMQDASTIRGSEDIQTEDKDAPSSNLSTLPHDSKGVACPPFSSVSPSPSPNLDCPFSASIVMSSSKSDSSSGSPGNTQSKWTEGILHENSLSASGIISSPHPSSNNLPPSAYLDLNCLSFFAESFSQSPENKSKESVFSDSVGKGLFQEPNKTQKEQDEAPSFLSFQLDKDNPSAPSPPALDSFEFEDAHHTLSCLSRETFIPFCLSAESSLPHPDLDRIDPAAGRISELREQSISQQGQSCSHNDNADLTTSSTVQEVIHAKMHIEDSLKRNRKGEGERHTDSVQTQDSVVCISDTESSAGLLDCSRLASVELCHQTEIDPHVLLCSQREEFLAVTKQEELRRVCQMEINGTQSESPRSYFILNELSETQSGASMEAEDLTKNESLDLVFETSVDGMEGENGDVDAFFEQLATEGQVYWAEPIQVLSPTHDGSPGNSWLPLDSATLDSISTTGNALPLSLSSSATVGSDQNSRNTTASPDTPSSTTLAPFLSPPETPNLRLPRRSVSVQISSSLSSHIVHRKDVPYVADSKRTLVPSVFSLDTSDPFRAVQAWTDMQIQRNMEKLSCTVPNEVGATEMTQKSPLIFASSPSFPLLSNDCQLHDCFPGMVGKTASVSVDTGLGPDKEEEVYRNGTRDKENLWEGNPSVTMACCCSCDHQCSCCRSYNRQHTLGNVPLSLGDLEEMMLCLQHFRLVHSNIEEQLSEDHVSLHRALSDQDRENIRDLEVLRRAVKQEAAELEVHLNHLVHYYDDSLKMKMHRLLDEQSLLCSQLRVFEPGAVSTPSSPAPSRTVATQCRLRPRFAPAE